MSDKIPSVISRERVEKFRINGKSYVIPSEFLTVVLDDENWIEVYGPNQNVNAVIAGSSSALFLALKKFKIY